MENHEMDHVESIPISEDGGENIADYVGEGNFETIAVVGVGFAVKKQRDLVPMPKPTRKSSRPKSPKKK